MNNLGRMLYNTMNEKEQDNFCKVVLARSKIVCKGRSLSKRFLVYPQLSVMKARNALNSYDASFRCPVMKVRLSNVPELKALPGTNTYRRDFAIFSYITGWAKSKVECRSQDWKPSIDKDRDKELNDKLKLIQHNLKAIAINHPQLKYIFLEDYKTWCKLTGKRFKESECWDYFLDLSREKC